MILTAILAVLDVLLTVVLWKDIKFLCEHMWND